MKRYSSYSQTLSELQNGNLSCESLVRSFLQEIEAQQQLNAFLEVFEETAVAQAKAVDAKLSKGNAGPLAGMVIGIKDNICYKGHTVSAGSQMLKGFESLYSATAVERLLAQDAIIIGRLNCDEFGMGNTNEHSAFGPVKNPLDETKTPGGSSGGSAAAVAAELCHAALGSDTGGSIRQPAAFCGLVGLKPTYGCISRHGLIAYGSSFDQIGPITNSIEDAALLLEIMAGPDEHDATASNLPVPSYTILIQSGNIEPKRIAVLKPVFEENGLDAEIHHALELVMNKLQQAGHTVDLVEFPMYDQLVPAYCVLTMAEASSNLARYDGMRFGHRSSIEGDLNETYTNSRSEGFGQEVKRRIMAGSFVLSAGNHQNYYAQAQKVRRIIRDHTHSILSEFDFILGPTTPTPAFSLGTHLNDPVARYLEDRCTVHASLTGLPAISLPVSQASSGLPIGFQLTGKAFEETELLRFSNYIINTV